MDDRGSSTPSLPPSSSASSSSTASTRSIAFPRRSSSRGRRRLRALDGFKNASSENGRDAIPAAGREGVGAYPVVGSGPSRGCALARGAWHTISPSRAQSNSELPSRNTFTCSYPARRRRSAMDGGGGGGGGGGGDGGGGGVPWHAAGRRRFSELGKSAVRYKDGAAGEEEALPPGSSFPAVSENGASFSLARASARPLSSRASARPLVLQEGSSPDCRLDAARRALALFRSASSIFFAHSARMMSYSRAGPRRPPPGPPRASPGTAPGTASSVALPGSVQAVGPGRTRRAPRRVYRRTPRTVRGRAGSATTARVRSDPRGPTRGCDARARALVQASVVLAERAVEEASVLVERHRGVARVQRLEPAVALARAPAPPRRERRAHRTVSARPVGAASRARFWQPRLHSCQLVKALKADEARGRRWPVARARAAWGRPPCRSSRRSSSWRSARRGGDRSTQGGTPAGPVQHTDATRGRGAPSAHPRRNWGVLRRRRLRVRLAERRGERRRRRRRGDGRRSRAGARLRRRARRGRARRRQSNRRRYVTVDNRCAPGGGGDVRDVRSVVRGAVHGERVERSARGTRGVRLVATSALFASVALAMTCTGRAQAEAAALAGEEEEAGRKTSGDVGKTSGLATPPMGSRAARSGTLAPMGSPLAPMGSPAGELERTKSSPSGGRTRRRVRAMISSESREGKRGGSRRWRGASW